MNNTDIARGVISGLNSIANPQSLTVQTMNTIINSPYTKETIRGLILDPIAKKLIPTKKLFGYKDFADGGYALYLMLGEKFISNILKINPENRHSVDEIFAQYSQYAIFRYIDTGEHQITELVRYNGCAIYLQYRVDFDKYIYYWNLYFVGPTAKNTLERFESCYKDAVYANGDGMKEKYKRRVTVLTFQNGGRPKRGYCTVPNTVIVDHVKKDLDAIISAVKRSEEITENYEINKTTGVLLYGPHGTGKSTIARWLAMELNRDILLTSADSLEFAVDYVKDRPGEQFIILIEDIDFKFVDRRTAEKNDKNTEMMKMTDTLFQVLDGVLGENNLMVIATTNYIERLDPALIRDGRFDYQIEVTGLSYDEAVKVCERFDVSPEDIKLSEWETPITPASLQTIILKHKLTEEPSSN